MATAITQTRQQNSIVSREWTPKSICSLVWYDAADLSTISTINGRVFEWRDKSGNKRHLKQSQETRRPILKLNGLNGLPVVGFNRGANSSLSHEKFPTSTYRKINLYVVLKYGVFGTELADIQAICDTRHTSTAQFFIQDRPDLRDRPPYRYLTNSVNTSNGEIGNGQWIQLTNIISTNITEMHVNGRYNSSNAVFSFPVFRQEFAIMSTYALGRTVNGDCAEFIITDNPDPLEKNKMEQYLANKWGLKK